MARPLLILSYPEPMIEMGGFFDDIGSAVSSVAGGVASAVGSAASTVGSVASGISSVVSDVSGVVKDIEHLVPAQLLEPLDKAIASVGHIVAWPLKQLQAAVSLVPGIGSGISAAIEAGMAILKGGSPLEVAIHAAYGAIPIPPGLRTITDAVLEAVLDLAIRGDSLTDTAIDIARTQVPEGLPRDIFDTLIHLVLWSHPKVIKQAAQAAQTQAQSFMSAGIPYPVAVDMARRQREALVAAQAAVQVAQKAAAQRAADRRAHVVVRLRSGGPKAPPASPTVLTADAGPATVLTAASAAQPPIDTTSSVIQHV